MIQTLTTLADIARLIGVELPVNAPPNATIDGVADIVDATQSQIALLGSNKYLPAAASSKAAALVVARHLTDKILALTTPLPMPLLVVDNADLAFAKLLQLFAPPDDAPDIGIHPQAYVHPTANVHPSARIGPLVCIDAHASIGPAVALHSGVHIGKHVSIGQGCVLHPGVVVRSFCSLGQRVTLQSNVTIGGDGFGYRFDGKQHVKIPQTGRVDIHDDVEIGAGSCVDRAKTGSTVIGRGTKIDNLVQIGHNCHIGPLNIVVAGVSIGGSVTTGVGVVIGGHSAIRDHLKLGDHARVAAFSGVINDVPPGHAVGGYHAIDLRKALRSIAASDKLPDLLRRLQALERDQTESSTHD